MFRDILLGKLPYLGVRPVDGLAALA